MPLRRRMRSHLDIQGLWPLWGLYTGRGVVYEYLKTAESGWPVAFRYWVGAGLGFGFPKRAGCLACRRP